VPSITAHFMPVPSISMAITAVCPASAGSITAGPPIPRRNVIGLAAMTRF
jgi:hypothetical protein